MKKLLLIAASAFIMGQALAVEIPVGNYTCKDTDPRGVDFSFTFANDNGTPKLTVNKLMDRDCNCQWYFDGMLSSQTPYDLPGTISENSISYDAMVTDTHMISIGISPEVEAYSAFVSFFVKTGPQAGESAWISALCTKDQ